MRYRNWLITGILLFASSLVYAQIPEGMRYGFYNNRQSSLDQKLTSKIGRRLDYRFQTVGSFASGDHNAFWHTSMKQGLASEQTLSGYLRLALAGGMTMPSDLSFDYGIDAAISYGGMQSDFYLQQMYVDLGYKCLHLEVGPRERWGEIVDPMLSMGSLSWSGNSRPIPQVRISVPEFSNLGLLGSWLSVKGHLAYGWYEDGNWRKESACVYSSPASYVTDILYHSKAAFIRVGKVERFPLRMIFGLEMYDQFGGYGYNVVRVDENKINRVYDEFSFPHDFKAYLQALLPINPVGGQDDDNGNSLGSWHLAFEFNISDWQLKTYYEHFFEDHSSMLGIEYKNDLNGKKEWVSYGFRHNWADGLYGIELTAPQEGGILHRVVLEFLNTKGMCGPVYRYAYPVIKENVDGRDGMYTNKVYSSYSNWGFVNGTPVLVSPVFNDDGDLRVKSNRAVVFHTGIDGSFSKQLDYRIRATSSRHWGTYEAPFTDVEHITSVQAEITWWQGDAYSWRVSLSVAADFDSDHLIGNNKGLMITVNKVWDIL